MKRRSLLFGVAFAFGLVTLPVHVSSAVPAEVSESAVEGSSARIKACRDAATKKGDVKVDILFVIDTSTSLRDSDPFGKTIRDPARVRAMESVVSMLRSDSTGATTKAGRSSRDIRIRVNFLDFGTRVRASFESRGWQRIEDFSSDSLKEFGNKNDDDDTDYVGALIDRDGVVNVLSKAINESDCQVVLWFTDGKFEFQGRNRRDFTKLDWLEAELGVGKGVVRDTNSANLARQTGEKILCESGVSRQRAVSDDIRALDVGGALTVIGVGLNTTAADNFAVLRRLLEDKDCGSLDPVGFLVEVKSADDLAAAMRRAIFGGPPPPPPVCDISPVGPGASFYIAEPVRRADLFLRAREKVSEIQLVRLGGNKAVVITLFRGGAVRPAESIEGIRVSTRQLDDAPTFETTLQFGSPTEQWVGDWVLRACNESGLPAEIDADLVIRGCIAFDLAAGYDRIVVGRSSSLFLMLKRCGEDASRLSTVTALTLSATMLIDGKRVDAVLAENETLLEVPFAPTEESLGGSASKRIKLQVIEVNATYEVLSGSRPVVLEWSKDNSVFDISLVAPPNTPYVELVSCRDIVERTRSAVCEFKATAKDAVGRVSTEGARILPGAVLGDGVVFRASSSTRFPLTVRPGSPETFTFTFDLEGVRKNERVATQSFEVEFSYETDGEPVETGVVSGEFAVEPNLSVSINRLRALVFALVGLVVALAIFALARYLFATIQVPREGMLWGGCIDVPRCDPETVRAALRTAEVDFDALPISPSRFGVKKVNELGMVGDNGLSLRARAGWRLLSELGYVEAAHSEFPVIGSNGVAASRMRQSRSVAGRTPLNLVGQWWLIPQGSVDVNSESIDDVVARLESLKGKLVFVASTAEPPQTFFSDLGFTIAGGVSLGLSEVAKRLVGKAPKSEPVNDGSTTSKDGSGPKVPEI